MKKSTDSVGSNLSHIMTYAILIICSGICIFPFLWMVSTSFKGINEVYLFPPTIVPNVFVFENYSVGWGYADFMTYSKNTLFLAVINTVGVVFSASFVAYGFSKFKAKLSGFLYIVLLGTIMLPGQVTLIPQYIMYSGLGMVDTFWPLIIPSWLGGGVFNIFLFMQFFRTLPKDLSEAATIDGANSFQIYYKIMLPSVKPVAIAVAVMSLVYNWNDFFTPLIYLNTDSNFTIAIGLRFFQSAYGSVKIGPMMAVATLTLIPVLIIFVICQKYFIEGIKMSGIKG